MDFKNYIKLHTISPRYHTYMFVDTLDYLADSLFIQHKVKVKFGTEFVRPETTYCFITCKIRKKDESAFLSALKDLKNKMLLFGHNDYQDFCEQFNKEFQDHLAESRKPHESSSKNKRSDPYAM